MRRRNQSNWFQIINTTIDHLYLREGLRHCWSSPDRKEGSDCRKPDPQNFLWGARPTRLNNPSDFWNNYATSQYNLPYPEAAKYRSSSIPLFRGG